MEPDTLRRQIRSCRLCELVDQCRKPVPFRGPVPARIAVVGEAPGQEEDRQGQPFIGQSGRLLWSSLRRVGIDEDDVFVCNAVSCYPGEFRNPYDDHVESCWTNLYAQLRVCDPEWILLLGRVAMNVFLPELKISAYHGTAMKLRVIGKTRKVFVCYHPSYILRNRTKRGIFEHDLKEFAGAVG